MCKPKILTESITILYNSELSPNLNSIENLEEMWYEIVHNKRIKYKKINLLLLFCKVLERLF